MRYQDCFIPFCVSGDCEGCDFKKSMEELKRAHKAFYKSIIDPFVKELNKFTEELHEKGIDDETIAKVTALSVSVFSIETAKGYAKTLNEYGKEGK